MKWQVAKAMWDLGFDQEPWLCLSPHQISPPPVCFQTSFPTHQQVLEGGPPRKRHLALRIGARLSDFF